MKPPLPLFENLSEWGTLSPGLERVTRALNALQRPHLHFKHILVGGTNGKGTVCANVAAAFPGRVGLFLSPHIYDIRERISIDGSPVEDLLWQWAYELACREGGLRDEDLSYFEWLVVLATLIFSERRVDLAVFEVGLGGELDATNALSPSLSAITNVGLDHQAQLGPRVQNIAIHKLGIGRPSKPFLIPSDVIGYREVVDFLNERELSPQVFENKGVFDDNFALANRILAALGQGPIGEPLLLPGRREIVSRDPLVYLDGSHNIPSWEATREWYRSMSNEKCNLCVTMTQGRDVTAFLEIFKDTAECVYRFSAGYERELSEDQWPAQIENVEHVQHRALFCRPLLVCGSLYMIAPFRKWFAARGWG